mmetsp:Transcript_81362/g.226586  ORF Transcript_81362/g.226586 Transcript_81362/m.226586 type:complete len:610 (+) Transcript_81362:57-1886(+)
MVARVATAKQGVSPGPRRRRRCLTQRPPQGGAASFLRAKAVGLSCGVCTVRGAFAAHELDSIPVESLAPWYCPPLGTKARACVQKYQPGRSSPYLEETMIPWSIKVLMALNEEPGVDAKYFAPIQALLTLLEAVRLIACGSRFQPCYDAHVLGHMFADLCALARLQQQMLVAFGSLRGDPEPICDVLFRRGDVMHLLRSLARPLQGLVEQALPEAAPPQLGNNGSRFDFEHFFEARGLLWTRRKETGVPARPMALTSPAIFSPSGVCGSVEHGGASPPEGPDVDKFLGRLASAGVAMSRFVVNFGAADGECGAADDWNADPANCLALAGSAAVLIEGNKREFGPSLRRHYGGRSNVSLVLEFVPLANVSMLLREQLRVVPAASASPDLLKVDIDHADCLFFEEALHVLSPKLIHFEYVPQVPPPLDYAQRYQPGLLDVSLHDRQRPRLDAGSSSSSHAGGRADVDKGGLELPGCSLAAFLARAPGYELAAVGDEEALLVRTDLQLALGVGPPPDVWAAYLRGNLCHPLRGTGLDSTSWGFDFRALADPAAPPKERLRWLAETLGDHGASKFTLRLHGRSATDALAVARSQRLDGPSVVGSLDLAHRFSL